ncbi:hypothetical protein E2C01_013342 [Portunus trituberculatus]|uniref:Uncharacterized protein n=1 Tax=Portunus trituberculatus TaxID=210409 RepID=A0A5B7DGE2_PORTR|nr:hypothetical protein [Portunus trituberculatus]
MTGEVMRDGRKDATMVRIAVMSPQYWGSRTSLVSICRTSTSTTTSHLTLHEEGPHLNGEGAAGALLVRLGT